MFLKKNYEAHLPLKDPMFPEVVKYIHKFASLKNVNGLFFSCH